MNPEVEIHLDKFQLRPYQAPLWDALENKGYRRALAILPRRAGKDICAWNLMIRQCLTKICIGYYIFPTYALARKALFDSITSDSVRFLDFIPKQVIASINAQQMKITFINGSILQCIGGDKYDSIRGTNPYAVVLSEYGYFDDGIGVLDVLTPILSANGGWLLIVSTPNGKNFMWLLYKMALELSYWYVAHKTVEDTKHIPREELDRERARMSYEKFMQEYYCSFERGVEGQIYGYELQNLEKKGQITSVSWEPGLLVHCSIDIGVNDATTILWYQIVGGGTIIRIIDCYSNSGLGLDHYVKVLREKPYTYGTFFAPHDLKVREWGNNAITRYEKARQLGIDFHVLPQMGLQDGIENVKTHFPKFWIDKENCRSLVDALENYYREWDEKHQIYNSKPVHNWASHYADGLRYLCASLSYVSDSGINKDDFNRMLYERKHGSPLHNFMNNGNQTFRKPL